MGNWKYFRIAVAIADLAKTGEEKGKRKSDALLNINKALDKDYEKNSFKELVKAPLSAFQGLSKDADETLKNACGTNLKSIGDLGKLKYFHWAASLTTLADYENADFSSK